MVRHPPAGLFPSSVLHKCQSQCKLKNMNAAEEIPTKHKSPADLQKARLPNDWTQDAPGMTPDRMDRGSFLLGRNRSGLGTGNKKEGRKNPPQHEYHIICRTSSQRRNLILDAKSVLCTKVNFCIWQTFRLEKLKIAWYYIGTKRRYLNSKSSGGLPKAKVNNGNQSDFKSK